jgi:hypothetical protein
MAYGDASGAQPGAVRAVHGCIPAADHHYAPTDLASAELIHL